MIPLWLQITESCFSIFASLATILGAGFAIGACVRFFKNLVNKNNVRFILDEIMEEDDESLKLLLRIENHTDKSFFITQIDLINRHNSYSAKECYRVSPQIYNLRSLKPIQLSAFECIKISPIFQLEKSKIDRNAKLVIQTTAGKNINLLVSQCQQTQR